MLDAGRVDDSRDAVEARLVEIGDREVERRLVQQLGQHLLIELGVDLAAAQRHLGDRAHARSRRDADAAQRGDHAASRRLGEVEAAGLRGEQVGDVPGDQRAGGGHPDEDRSAPGADAGRGLLAERGVGLVADHDRVRVGDAADVAYEPLVGLDRDRPVGGVVAVEQRRGDAVAVAAVAQLAVELVDEVAAVGEDQDAAGPAGLDEAERRDGLTGAGGVLEPEALVRVGILGLLLDLAVAVFGVLPVLRLLVELALVLLVGFRPVLRLVVVGVELRVVLGGAVALARGVALGRAVCARGGRRVAPLPLPLAALAALVPLARCRCRC